MKPGAYAAMIRSLTLSLHKVEGNDSGDVNTSEGDLIAGLRDYLEGTNPGLPVVTFEEIGWAWLAGAEHATGEYAPTRAAYKALHKALRLHRDPQAEAWEENR
jgi:hypothetical protein